MAGDISRSSFTSTKHFSGVRMQQGRVQLDADWNEQVDIATYFTRAATADLIGPCAAPVSDAGFGISVQGGNLAIGAGRIYVGGILCENSEPALVTGTATSTPPVQPDLPGYTLPTQPGSYEVYLDVWEREVTALEDPSILEVALSGVDTTTRTRIVWQVKLLANQTSCTQNLASFLGSSTGTMQAQAQPNAGASTPCAVPAQAGYSSLENQLYRIEVHTPGNASTATFKWSRDNGSVVAAWLSSPASDQLVVSTLGRDQVLGFAGGQWVELTDDTHELNGLPGTLVQLSNAQMVGQAPTLTLNLATASGPTGALTFPVNPKVRRWDQAASASVTLTNGAMALQEGTWLSLENGVQVQFDPGGFYHTGDYWLVPGRTATALSSPSLVWPVDASSNPLFLPSLGIVHHYGALATVTLAAGNVWTVNSDCRLFFGPTAVPGAMRVTDLRFLQPAGELGNDTLVPLTTFLNGFKITCDQPIDPATIKLATFSVTLDTPVDGADSVTTGIYPGAIPMKLMANLAVGDTGNVSAFWIPTPQTRAYVLEQMATFGAQTENNGEALVAVTLKGSFVWEQGVTSTLVNGPAFGTPQNGSIGLQLPSGDGRRGGDFQCWFWVPGYTDPNFPKSYVPFTSYYSIAGPDSSGDYVVVGEMTAASIAELVGLPESDVKARKIYSNPIEMAPGLEVFAYVPTDLERGGNFSAFGEPIYDPKTGSPYPGNVIPAADQPSGIHFLAKQQIVVNRGPGGEINPGGGQFNEGGPGIFAWRIRGKYTPPASYGYGYGYGGAGLGAELI
jgi:hypothetical protein